MVKIVDDAKGEIIHPDARTLETVQTIASMPVRVKRKDAKGAKEPHRQATKPKRLHPPPPPPSLPKEAPWREIEQIIDGIGTIVEKLDVVVGLRPVAIKAPLIERTMVGGVATGGGNFLLIDRGKSWETNVWENYEVAIVDGTGAGQIRTIVSNEADSLAIRKAWDTNPDKTSVYVIRMARININLAASAVIQDVDITAQTIGNLSVNLAASTVTLDVNLISQTAIIDVDLVAQTVGNISVDLVAQTVGNISVDLVAQTVGNISVDLVAQTLGNISVDLAAQSIGNVNVDLIAQSVGALNFNIKAQAVTLNVKFLDQTKGMMSAADWATREAADIHLQGATTELAAEGEATLLTLTLATNKEHWLYTVHISGTQKGLGKVRANKTAGYDELAYGYFPADDGYIKNWLSPVKRRRDSDAGITEITVEVKNNGSAAGDFAATLDGLKIIDITLGEEIYTTQAEWEACASSSHVDTTTSSGDVLLAIEI